MSPRHNKMTMFRNKSILRALPLRALCMAVLQGRRQIQMVAGGPLPSGVLGTSATVGYPTFVTAHAAATVTSARGTQPTREVRAVDAGGRYHPSHPPDRAGWDAR